MLPKAPRPVFSDSLDGGTPPQLHCCAEYPWHRFQNYVQIYEMGRRLPGIVRFST